MTDDPLYRREILRLAADATGAGHLPAPDAAATAHNPACGDRVTVELALADGRVTALAHAHPGLRPDPGFGGTAGEPGARPDPGRAGGSGGRRCGPS